MHEKISQLISSIYDLKEECRIRSCAHLSNNNATDRNKGAAIAYNNIHNKIEKIIDELEKPENSNDSI